jgi:hypothetical protein
MRGGTADQTIHNGRGRSSIGRAPALQAGCCGFKSRRLHQFDYLRGHRSKRASRPDIKRERKKTKHELLQWAQFDVLFDKLGWWNEIVEDLE